MLMLILNVVYVLVAVAMIALILMQRGSGAAAGSGFGAGASGTVFGARGASNFMSKSTKWLAVVFFGISLFMAWYAGHGSRPAEQQGLGLMAAPAASVPAAPAGERPASVPAAAPVPVQQPAQQPVPAATVPAQAESSNSGEEKQPEGSQKD
ncbi:MULTISPECIES: preprotein translocase subunit SecG [unclassified Stenotrophomonas]|jgi:preprotein translocase subunit SecG|uniref:preprotein translocase subunit SecG n=1 Tax=unclassified Stenotrophomonas TaxID=196198 RepID=UPI0005AF2C46|nr:MULTISPECIES: preprotein translocase subunit SecG [unclassified Stenotrophomonas]KIP81228.1 preprotein translocase subunit SecG [Stenotrophomonas maltophilia]MBD8642708.1 preprotein translocase subunit SecG [Stenotrophomonas sp. CFBP 13724]MDY1031985.1 preprotein translocase subunit SecG [Stenotrophomonas sp. CFBP8980]